MQPPTTLDAPPIQLPSDVGIIISEQPSGESGWTMIYHGLAASTEQDMVSIEAAAPFWLLEYLLANKAPQQSTVKISFTITRWGKSTSDPLPELGNKCVILWLLLVIESHVPSP